MIGEPSPATERLALAAAHLVEKYDGSLVGVEYCRDYGAVKIYVAKEADSRIAETLTALASAHPESRLIVVGVGASLRELRSAAQRVVTSIPGSAAEAISFDSERGKVLIHPAG